MIDCLPANLRNRPRSGYRTLESTPPFGEPDTCFTRCHQRVSDGQTGIVCFMRRAPACRVAVSGATETAGAAVTCT